MNLNGFVLCNLKIETPHVNNGDGPEKKVTRLAIGVEGGFDATQPEVQYDIKENYSLVLLPGFIRIELPKPELPQTVSTVLSICHLLCEVFFFKLYGVLTCNFRY